MFGDRGWEIPYGLVSQENCMCLLWVATSKKTFGHYIHYIRDILFQEQYNTNVSVPTERDVNLDIFMEDVQYNDIYYEVSYPSLDCFVLCSSCTTWTGKLYFFIFQFPQPRVRNDDYLQHSS